MKKIIFFLSVIFITSIVLVFYSKTTEEIEDDTLVLVMAEVNPADSVTGRFCSAFKEKVEQISMETIKIDLQFEGILGDESQVMNLIKTPDSSIHLARVSASLASYGGKKSKLITIPYTFSNTEHFWKFAESELAEEILEEPYILKLGVKGLCYGEEGFRHFFSTKELNSLDDMKGKQIRVSNSETLKNLALSFGGNPVTIKFTDLYANLQTGIVNVAEQPLTNYYSNKFHLVAPNVILDGHNLGAIQILINSATWNRLTNGQRKILTEAGRYASSECKKIAKEFEDDIKMKLIAEGVTIVDVTDKTDWKKACEGTIKEASKEYPELYKKIQDLNK